MKLREIFRFEVAYQIRRPQTWLFFVILAVTAFQTTRASFLQDALYDDYYLNSPFIIAFVSVVTSMLWIVLAATVAGEAAARDPQTGMDPLAYTAPVSKAEYLGGRFLAAFALNALILLAVPLGILVSLYAPGVDPRVVGPFRPAAYLTAFGYVTLPNVFVGTSIQFAWAALGRRPILAYLGSVLLVFVAYGGIIFIAVFLEREELAALFDVFGHIFMTDDLILGWTPIERNTRLIPLEPLVARRLVWLGVALATLAFTYARFRFAHHTASPWWARVARRSFAPLRTGSGAHAPTPGGSDVATSPIAVPRVRQTFGLATHAQQALAIAWISFRTIAKGRGGFVVLAAIAGIVVLVLPQNLDNLGTPLLPATAHVLTFLTTALTNPLTPWVIVPLLTVLYAGELVWREREAGLGEITDAAPVPEWVLFVGRFLGLGLVLAMWMALLAMAGVLVQLRMGYDRFEIGLYLRVLFGLQLPEYLLFAALALVIQGVVNQKYLGHLAVLLAFASILFSSVLGVDHPLLVYGDGPGWSYSDMRGFGRSRGPWLWFKLYWAAWALLLAVAARLLWMRGMEGNVGVRLRLARRRFTRPTAVAAALAASLVLALGGFIFYNTNVINEYADASAGAERSAEYERRFRRYAGIPQPRLTGVTLRVEIHPERSAAHIRGTYHLVNRSAVPIDSVHLATVSGVETGSVAFDRPARRVVEEKELGHSIYALASPLQPGDTVRLTFEVRREPRGFRASGVSASVTANGTWFTSEEWLPAIGYQPRRELIRPGERREHGLPARPLIPTLADVQTDVTGEAGIHMAGADPITVEAVVGTDADQVAVGPGTLRRTWREGGRRYFHYATDTPIGEQYSFFSARYAVRESRWNHVAIRVYHHPAHTANLDRILRSAVASLEHNSREYGPYRYGQLTLVENPARGFGAHAEASVIDFGQGFALWNTDADPRGLDFPFAVMAHEMGHQFCCPYAPVEGAGLLTESFAWYAAMGVVEETYGREHLQKLLRFFRQPHPIPPIRQSVPLLRGMDLYAAYRKGPFALYALREYMGAERVNGAFRRLREEYGSGSAPLPTSLDLYRELRAAAPDSLRYLVRDLIAGNTYWELATERAAAVRTGAGAWRVTLDVRARKLTVDSAGVETEVPMDEWVQVGVFAPTGQGADFGEELYLEMHRIRSGEQTISVTVPREPSDAGIDPYHLLIEMERFDNVEEVDIGS